MLVLHVYFKLSISFTFMYFFYNETIMLNHYVQYVPVGGVTEGRGVC